MNLRDLEYLIALDTWKNFGKAARESFVSQPTLSGQIKKLEEELGIILIERGTKGLMFTEPGLKVLERAKAVLSETKSIYEIAQSYANPLAGVVKLAVIPSIAPFLLPHLIQKLAQKLPNIEFILLEQQTRMIEDNLRSGEIDLAILALPIANELFVEHSLYIEPFFLAVPEKHRLAKRKSVTIEDFQGETLLLLEEGHCFGDQVIQLCHRNPDGKYDFVRGTSLETIVHMVRLGNGITLLPELTIRQKNYEFKESPLVYIPFKAPIPSREVGLIYRKSSPRQECFSLISEAITTTIHDTLGTNDSKLEVIPIVNPKG